MTKKVRDSRSTIRRRLSRMQKITLDVINEIIVNPNLHKYYVQKYRMFETSENVFYYDFVKWEVCRRLGNKEDLKFSWKDSRRDEFIVSFARSIRNLKAKGFIETMKSDRRGYRTIKLKGGKIK